MGRTRPALIRLLLSALGAQLLVTLTALAGSYPAHAGSLASVRLTYKVNGTPTEANFNPVSNNGVLGGYGYSKTGVGSFTYYLNPGQYRMIGIATNGLSGGISNLCTVSTDSTTDCPVAIPAPNFPFQITNSDGSNYAKPANLAMTIKRTVDGNLFDFSWNNTAQDSGTLALQDGTYLISVFNQTDAALAKANGQSVNQFDFNLVMSGGAVSSFGQVGGSSISPTGGKYHLPIKPNNFHS